MYACIHAGVSINDGRVDSGPARLRQTGADSRGQRHARLQPPDPNAILRPMQPQPAFDTYAFVKRLTHAGMPEDQAEVLANGQADLYERLVTKEYLEQKLGALELTLRNELEKVRAELKHEIDKVQANLEQVKAELKNDIETLRAELKHDIDKVQANLEITRTELKRDIKEMEQKLTIKLGALLVIGITVMTVLDKLL